MSRTRDKIAGVIKSVIKVGAIALSNFFTYFPAGVGFRYLLDVAISSVYLLITAQVCCDEAVVNGCSSLIRSMITENLCILALLCLGLFSTGEIFVSNFVVN